MVRFPIFSSRPAAGSSRTRDALAPRSLLRRAAVSGGVLGLGVWLVACGGSSMATTAAGSSSSATMTSTMTATMVASPMTDMHGTPVAATSAPLVSQMQQAGNYRLTLMVGSEEQMYTRQQADQQHPMSGEVMVSGAMSMPEGTPMAAGAPLASPMSAMAGDVKHLEVHVADGSGQTVADATVMIEVVDNSAGNMAETVPVATMYGVMAGMSDLHYGNNVTMPSNRDYTVNVTVNGQQATFKFHLGM